MITVAASDAGRRFDSLLHLVRSQKECIEVEDEGKPVARIIPAPEFSTGRALAEAWRNLPHLGAEEADLLETDLLAMVVGRQCLKNNTGPERARQQSPGLRSW